MFLIPITIIAYAMLAGTAVSLVGGAKIAATAIVLKLATASSYRGKDGLLTAVTQVDPEAFVLEGMAMNLRTLPLPAGFPRIPKGPWDLTASELESLEAAMLPILRTVTDVQPEDREEVLSTLALVAPLGDWLRNFNPARA